MTVPSDVVGEAYTVAEAVLTINRARPTGACNNTQLVTETGLSRHRVDKALHHLKRWGFVKDVGKGNAYRWRLTLSGLSWVKQRAAVRAAVGEP